MADSNDEKGNRPGARPAIPPFRGPAQTPRTPLTPPAGTAGPARPPLMPPAGGRAPFVPPLGSRPRPATPAQPQAPANASRPAITPPFAGRPVTPLPTPAITPQADPFAERTARAWIQPETPTPEEEFVAAQGTASGDPRNAPVEEPTTAEPAPAGHPAAEPEVAEEKEAEHGIAAAAERGPEPSSPSAAEGDQDEDPFADWDAQLREEQSAGPVAAGEPSDSFDEAAADAPTESEWSDASFDLAGEAMRSLPPELSMPGAAGGDISLPEATDAPFDTTDEVAAQVRRAEEPEAPAEKVGLYGDSAAPMAEDVVPAAAAGEPAIEAMPRELLSAYPSLQDTSTYETQRPSGAIYAGEPAEAWAAATAGDRDPGAGDRAARTLERIAARVRSGDLALPATAEGAGDAAVLAALLAAMLGGSRESGA